MHSTVFLIGCLLACISTLAVLAWSPKPCGAWCHLRGLARLAVLAGAAFGAARAASGWTPPWDGVLLVWGVGVVYAVQAHAEAARQRRRSVS